MQYIFFFLIFKHIWNFYQNVFIKEKYVSVLVDNHIGFYITMLDVLKEKGGVKQGLRLYRWKVLFI